MPSQASPEGPASGMPTGAFGSCGAKYWPNRATKTTTKTIVSPSAPENVRSEAQAARHAGSRSFGTSSSTIRSATRFRST